MFKNYFTIAYRHLLRNKVFSLISIAGLAIGFACVMWISLYTKNELAYDGFIQDANRVYRVNMEGKMGDSEFNAGYTPPPAGDALLNNFPEVESYTRIYRPGNQLIRYSSGDTYKAFTESGMFAVDANFLQVLTYPLKQGNAATCLLQPNSIVITEAIAKKYFGNTDVIGKLLMTDVSKNPLKVTGVLKDVGPQSSLKFDMLIPVQNCGEVKYFSWSWVWLNMATYVKLKPVVAANPDVVKNMEAKFPAMVKVQAATAFNRIGQHYEAFLKKGGRWNLHLQALRDVHLRSAGITSAITNQGDIKNLYIFAAVGLFVITLACVNFINLSTAQAAKRAKEIGVRKVVGSGKKALVQQFLTETFLFGLVSMALGLVLIIAIIPLFNQLSGKNFQPQMMFNSFYLALMVALIGVVTFLAGGYPAFYLASFKPVSVLKGAGLYKTGMGVLNIRNGLVVFQFTVSTALMVCTLVVYLQLHYIQNRDLGFNKENVVVLPNAEKLGQSEETFRQELAAMPQVKAASISTSIFTKSSFGDFYVPVANQTEPHVAKDITLNSYLVDQDFTAALNLKVLKGRSFNKNFNDSLSVVLNEAAVKQIGWKNPIGQYIRYPGGKYEAYKVVGVVKDFNLESLHDIITPFALFNQSSKSYDTHTSFVIVKLKAGNPAATLRQIATKWKNYNAVEPFDYTFLNNDLNALYITDQRTGNLLTIFTSLSIFVACLGLLGLVVYTAERRTKEIGIRKVLGASVAQITLLLSKDFVQLVLLAILIASPIAWYAMHQWLQNFAYHIAISWWIFAVGGMLAIVIACVTLSFQSVKAATANPVKNLKTE
ncbi:FtsX-like permease family protein [Mucilaginibacter robiniae]|uniref:FtsX-like permease family protein n=1 Tax=Mucilaginibacter robiniae TaxID=2728022 RepID=A0A7L5DXV1_9SPHI|nr:ABC transporter permease [Mucilaginibacter robiniae]QJD94937.1 FtsX-like permease family protein [Mucilaginibacter robiniae]